MPSIANKNTSLKTLIGLLIIYLLVKIVFSIISIELFVQNIPVEAKLITRITAIFSTVFSSISSWLPILALFFIVWYASKLCFENLSFDPLIKAYQTTLVILIAAEILKFGFVWLFLVDEITLLDLSAENLVDQIKGTNYHLISRYTDKIAVGASCFFFYLELDQKIIPRMVISTIYLIAFLLITLI
jgi:hypothetical protein